MNTEPQLTPSDRAVALVDLMADDSITEALHHEHEVLQGGLIALHDAITAGANQESVATILGDVECFCLAHFEGEEQFFHDRNCPKVEEHKIAHRQLIHRLGTVRMANITGRLTESDVSALNVAFNNHVVAFDKPAHVWSLWQHFEVGNETSQQIKELCSLDRLGKVTW